MAFLTHRLINSLSVSVFMFKAQSSVEALLLIAGMLAFFVAIAPIVSQAASATRLLGDTNHYNAQLDRVVIAVNEASAFGPGNAFSFQLVLRHPVRMRVDGGVALLTVHDGNQSIALQKNATANAYADFSLPKGTHDVTALNEGNRVLLKPKNNSVRFPLPFNENAS